MLDFGWAELLIIVAVAVFVIGPKDIPNIMYGLGRLVRRFQYIKFAVSQQFDDIMHAGDMADLRKGVNFEQKRTQNDINHEMQEDMQEDMKEGTDEDENAQNSLKFKEVKPLYKIIAKDYAAEFTEKTVHIDKFLKHLPAKGAILDVGCGVGVDTAYMNNKKYDVTAIDVSNDMLEIAKENHPSLKFLEMDMRHLDFDKEQFDGVLASYSLIHLKKGEIDNVIQSIFHVLKNQGIFCLSFHGGTPSEVIIPEPFDPSIEFFMNIMSASEMEDILKKNDFKILDSFERNPESNIEFSYSKICIMAQKN